MGTIRHEFIPSNTLSHSIGKIIEVKWGNIVGDINKQKDLAEYIETILLNYPTIEEFTKDLDKKVDKIEGYGLSKNDFTDVLKALYDDAVVKSHIHQNKAFLDSLTSLKTINNESIIGEGNIKIEGTGGVEEAPKDGKQYARQNGDWTEVKGGSEKPEGGWKKDDLSTGVQESLNKADSAVQPEEGKGLFSGDYNDLQNTPYIPINVSDLHNDSGYITSSEASETYQPIGDYPTKEEVEAMVTPTTPNIIKFGDINITDGQMSGFSATNYAQFPFLVDLTDKVFTIVMQITTSDNVTTQQNILDSQDGLAFAVRNGQFVLAVSNNGTQWAFEAVGGTVLPNTTYYIRLGWDKAIYTVYYSTDNGKTWTEAISQNSTLSPYPRTMLIGKDATDRYIFGGSINLNKCTLAINGQYVWDGMTDAGLLTRLDTSLSNIDSAGIEYIKTLAPTPKEWYGTQAEFDALEEYEEDMKYYIYDDGTTPMLTNYLVDDMAIPTFDDNFNNEVMTEYEAFDAPLDEDVITEEDNKDA